MLNDEAKQIKDALSRGEPQATGGYKVTLTRKQIEEIIKSLQITHAETVLYEMEWLSKGD